MIRSTWSERAGSRTLRLLVACVALVLAAACGGGERLSQEEFGAHLESMERRESDRYERLAEQAMRLEPDAVLPAELRQGMLEYGASLKKAADELEELTPPEEAEAASVALVAALRERAEAFEEAAAAEGATLAQLESDGRATAAGEAIERAFQRLRAKGFLAGG